MINLTLHAQSESELRLAAAYGLALDPAPRGVEAGPGPGGFGAAVNQLAGLLRQASAARTAVLAGGHTGLWISAVCRVLEEDRILPAIWVFETRRVRDSQNRFIFQPQGLLNVVPAGQDEESVDVSCPGSSSVTATK